jgi:pentatricopeptide repeat protein
LFNC